MSTKVTSNAMLEELITHHLAEASKLLGRRRAREQVAICSDGIADLQENLTGLRLDAIALWQSIGKVSPVCQEPEKETSTVAQPDARPAGRSLPSPAVTPFAGPLEWKVQTRTSSAWL